MRGGARGHTLAELCLVVVLVGIMASLATPVFTEAAARMRVRAAANRVAVDLAHARMTAVRTGHSAVLVLERSPECALRYRGRVAGHRYHVRSRAEPERPVRVVDLRERGGRVCLEMGQRDSIVFNSRGLLPGVQNRTLWMHERAMVDSLSLSAVGRVRRRY